MLNQCSAVCFKGICHTGLHGKFNFSWESPRQGALLNCRELRSTVGFWRPLVLKTKSYNVLVLMRRCKDEGQGLYSWK